MKKIEIEGGSPLFGEITVSGSKNAALPIIFSCILTKGISKIENLPDIGDVHVALELLSDFGAKILYEANTLIVNTENLVYVVPKSELVSEIRASTYLIGSCLSRFGLCHLQPFGGCSFANRPIDMHLSACRALGANVNENEISADRLCAAEIVFDKPSVGATVNAILLSVCAEGKTIIRGCATEPHIDSLIDFLSSCGASIHRSDRDIFIEGRELHGGSIRIIGDMIETGSYLAAGLITEGEVVVRDAPIDDMTATLEVFDRLGAEIFVSGSTVSARMRGKSKYLSVIATPYPGFPTDLQPIIAPLMAKYSGGGITDTVWQTRFGYLRSLSNFGVASQMRNNSVFIGKSVLNCGKAISPDLRGGFACILTSLVAHGKSEIYSAEIILRGYENLEKKLRSIGAQIKIK